MDRDSEIGNSGKASLPQPPFQAVPNITKDVMQAYYDRERGCRGRRSHSVSDVIKTCAEDELVKKEYKEMKCGIPGLTKSTFLMVFSPDGTKMASTHGNHNVYITDLRTGKNVKTLVGHPRTPWCVAFHPSCNQILASGCLGGQVRIWDLSGGSEVWTAESQTVISSLAFHPVDRLLVIATYNELYFWDWSQPKPFMQTCTNNAKEKVRYVAFDRLGHKLITGIANTPQGFTRWERVRAPVPVVRHSDRITAYRRRITPRLVPPQGAPIINSVTTAPQQSTSVTTNEPQVNVNSIPEREQRIAVCYRNLVKQYEMLVQRYLEVYRTKITIDRGTDPMESEHLASTSGTSNPGSSTSNPGTSGNGSTIAPTTSNPPTVGVQTMSTPTITQSSSSSPMPGPSGLNRLNRPTKRPNVSSKSDSSTVYQSDSSSSSDSDESPTPKRRISLVPNSSLFHKDPPKNTVDTGTSTNEINKFDKRKKVFMTRASQLHSMTRAAIGGGSLLRHLDASVRYINPPRNPMRMPGSEPVPGPSTSRLNEPSTSSGTRNDLPLPLSRLQGISEGSLSSADEVINFSERTGREESSETDPNDFSIETIYRNILSDLEQVRNASRSNTNRNNMETSNILQGFSQRLESIMNQSDAILTNLRQSMDILLEPLVNNNNNNNNNNTVGLGVNPVPASSDLSGNRYYLRRPPSFHMHTRQCSTRCTGTTTRTTPIANSPRFQGPRHFRYMRNRHPRPNINLDGVWRPFGDHNYPRDPDNNNQPRNANVEPISSLLTLSPRSPSESGDPQTPVVDPPRTSTPVPFHSDHNYPISENNHEPPTNPIDLPLNNQDETIDTRRLNPIADHTYPRIPQSSSANPDYLAPLVSSLQSTISHISMQTNLLRRQVESIELIDRARFEVYQLQEMRRMWEDVRRHLTSLNTIPPVRHPNITNVRQMMAWTRISDPSPSSESAQSSTEQSTPEPSTTDMPTPSTSRSSASSGGETRPNLNSLSYLLARYRQNHIKKKVQSRLYWRRRTMRNEQTTSSTQRRYTRGLGYRDNPSRPLRSNDSARQLRQNEYHLTEVTVSLMIRGLETFLIQQGRIVVGRETRTSPDRTNLERRRVLSERVIENRLRSARLRLNMLNGYTTHPPNLYDRNEYSIFGTRTDWMRYEARHKLSVYIDTFSRFAESRGSPLQTALFDQVKILIDVALLLTDLMLLQIMVTIPTSSGSFLDPERETLAGRIVQMCTNLLQTISHSRLSSLARILNSLRITARYVISSLRLMNQNRNRTSDGRVMDTSDLLLDLHRQLQSLYQFGNFLNQDDNSTEPVPSTSTEAMTQQPNLYRLGDLLEQLRSVRGRLEQVSQAERGFANNSSSTTEHEPTRSTDESPSDRESESFEGFVSNDYRDGYIDAPGALYRTSHVNLYPPEQSSSQSSPERLPPTIMTPRADRPWNVPTVQVNDVPVSTSESSIPSTSWHNRIINNRYLDYIRPLSAATGLFRPRYLIPLYAGVNPFDADLDEGQREHPSTYDGVMTTTVSPNHRIQLWDISKCCIPNISNHEKNVVISECKIHNDGSVDISRDGTMLVTLLPSGGYLNVTNRLGIYSIKWESLGQCLYTTSFEQNAISVSLSPISRHLIVGLASRRVTLLPSDRWTMARIFLLDDRKIKITGRGRLVVLRDLEQGRDRDLNFMSVNCIKWIPVSGQGIVYATNTGQLKVLT